MVTFVLRRRKMEGVCVVGSAAVEAARIQGGYGHGTTAPTAASTGSSPEMELSRGGDRDDDPRPRTRATTPHGPTLSLLVVAWFFSMTVTSSAL
jgi:hypothetical protein